MSPLDAALAEWAEQTGCAEISIDANGQVLIVWALSVSAGLALTILICIPQCCCGCSERRRPVDGPTSSRNSQEKPLGRNKGQNPIEDRDEFDDRVDDDPAPNLEIARLHLWRTSVTDASMGKHKWRPIWGTGLHELGKVGGAGTELYFRFLKVLGCCFAYMTAFSAPLLVFSVLGNFAPDTGNLMVKTTIGNIGRLSIKSNLRPEDRYVIVRCQGVPLSDMTQWLGWLDFCATLLFLCFACYMRFVLVPRTARKADDENITPRDFTVIIDYLPTKLPGEQHLSYQDDLWEFVQQRVAEAREAEKKKGISVAPTDSEVREVTLVRDYHQKFFKLTELAQLRSAREIAEYKREVKQVKKLDANILQLENKFGSSLNAKELDVLRAYVVLNTKEDVETLLRVYRLGNYALGRCCQRNKFNGRGLRVRRAENPSQIIWENQDLEYCWRMVRKLAILFAFFLLIFFSLGVVYGLGRAARISSPMAFPKLGFEGCDAFEAQKTDIIDCSAKKVGGWSVDFAEAQGGDDLNCWCASTGATQLVRDKRTRDACWPWLTKAGRANALGGAAAVCVVVINVFVEYVILYMAAFERPLTQSELQASIMQKVAIVQTLNTSLIVMLLDWHAPEWVKTMSLAIPGGSLLFRGDYNDVVRGWYASVGSAILLNMGLNALAPSLNKAFWVFFGWYQRKCCRGRMRHQKELLALYTNPDFEISANYAKMLNTVFCTMLYASGMPVLYVFAAASMFITYWTDKWVLLWGSKRPPVFDAAMPRQAGTAIVYACFLHACMSIVMLGQECVSPSAQFGGEIDEVKDRADDSGLPVDLMSERASLHSTWMNTGILAFLIALWVLWVFFWIFGGSISTSCKALRYCMTCGRRSRKVYVEGEHPLTWEDAVPIIKANCPPATYRMEKHPAFHSFGATFHLTGNPWASQSGSNWRNKGDAQMDQTLRSHASVTSVTSIEEIRHPEQSQNMNHSIEEIRPPQLSLPLQPDLDTQGREAQRGLSEASMYMSLPVQPEVDVPMRPVSNESTEPSDQMEA